MSEVTCRVCEAEPKKYKCPTCSIPYCSLACFKTHKATHPDSLPTANAPTEVALPAPPAPRPTPRYLKKRLDFSALAVHTKFQDLLKTQPRLLPSLQRIYAKTIEPAPEDIARRRRLETQGSRYRGGRGRGRGRGRGFVGRDERRWRWTPKEGDTDGMKLLKSFRDGSATGDEKEVMEAFVSLVEDIIAEERKETEGG